METLDIEIKKKLDKTDLTISYRVGKLNCQSAAELLSRILHDMGVAHHSVVVNEFDSDAEEQIKHLWNTGAKSE